MYPYGQSQMTTFLDLVNESNPGLVVELTPSMLNTLVPNTQTVPSGQIQDTNVKLSVVQGSVSFPYIGTQIVQYRRINLANFFLDMKPTLVQWQSAASLTLAQILSELNSQFGLALTTADFANQGLTVAANGSVSVAIASTSLCYKGTFTLYWKKSLQPLSTLFTTPGNSLTGKLFPGGNTFGGSRLPQGEYFAYGLNCTPIDTALEGLTSGAAPVWTSGNGQTVLSFLQQYIPALDFNSGSPTSQGGLQGLILTRYTLPSAAVPFANSSEYANVATIQSVTGNWFQGQILLHFN